MEKITRHGKVFICNQCDAIHIEFKNLNFNFSQSQYDSFANYLSKIDGESWERKNKDSKFNRKIIIPLGNSGANMLLSNDELLELRALLSISKIAMTTKKTIIGPFTFLCYYN
jgi:hypothetical protein